MSEKRKRHAVEGAVASVLDAQAESLASLDAPFPRGGGSDVAPLDIRRAGAEAALDVYEQLAAGADKKKGRAAAKAGKAAKRSAGAVPAARADKGPVTALQFAKMRAGTAILGQVAEVRPYKLTVALPNNLIGFVDLSGGDDDEDEDDDDESDDEDKAQLYTVGTWIRVMVTGVTQAPARRIQLAIDPALVNQGIDDDDWVPGQAVQAEVQSLEDRGAVVAFGAGAARSGFIATAQQAAPLREGQVFLATVLKAKGRVLQLTTLLEHPVLKTVHQPASLAPGAVVDAVVDELRAPNVLFTLFGHIAAAADAVHSGGGAAAANLVPGERVRARVLFSVPHENPLDPARALALTLLPHALALGPASGAGALAPGQTIETAKVLAAGDAQQGLFLEVGLPRPAFAHISRLDDAHVESLDAEKRFRVGTVHRARVLGFAPVDDIYQVSLAPKTLAQRFLSLAEVPVGAVVDGKVERILPKGGVIVSLGDGINGIVAEHHLSDVKLANPERRFKPGQKVSARVLAVDADRQQLRLTVKKTIVNWDGDVVSELGADVVGRRSIGSIVAFKERGAIVELFGGLKGYLPVREMSEATLSDPREHFRIGQSVTAYVLEADAETNRLILSLRGAKPAAGATASVEVLDIVSGHVAEKVADAFIVDLGEANGVLSFAHLTDDAAKIKAEIKALQVGATLDDLVVLEKTRDSVKLSHKPSLVAAARAGTLPVQIGDVVRGQRYAGYVRGVTDDIGLFVAFANKLVGLVPKSEIAGTSYKIGQSVDVLVTSVNLEKSRFMLTLGTGATVGANGTASGTANGAASGPLAQPGTVADAVINSVKASQLNVSVNGQPGRVEVSEVFDSFAEIRDPKRPLSQFKAGETLKVKVIGYHDARTHKFLPISHRGGTHLVLELSAKKSVVETGAAPLTLDDLNEGAACLAFVNNATEAKDALWANVTPRIRGRVAAIDLTTDAAALANVAAAYPVGAALSCTVLKTEPLLQLTALDVDARTGTTAARIAKVLPAGLLVRLPFGRSGFVGGTDSADSYERLAKKFTVGAVVPARVVAEGDNTLVSLRASVTAPATAGAVADRLVTSAAELKTGDVLRGFVKNIAAGGLFVEVGRAITGRVQISQLSDSYLKDWKAAFQVGDVVTAKVVAKENDRIELSLKSSVVSGKAHEKQGLADLEVGSVHDGTVRKVQAYGVFVNITGTRLSGLCHKSEVADRELGDLAKIFQEGDRVKVKVLAVNTDKQQISLGMKASYFENAEEQDHDDDEDDEDDEDEADAMEIETGDDEDDEDDREVLDFNELDDGDSDDDDDEDDSDDAAEGAISRLGSAGPAKGLSAGFDFAGEFNPGSDDEGSADSDSDSSDDEAPRKKKRKNNEFIEDKTALLNTSMPQSVQDFERLLVANPNSSVLWMNYMAFQLQLSEIDAARAIGRRALRTIAIRDEEDKLNIWVALLNLENSFGSAESTQEVFAEATQYMDARTMHLKMASIYAASDKLNEARNIYKAAGRRFGSEDLEVWTAYGKFMYDVGDADGARSVLDKAVRQLPERLHKDATVFFARQEYAQGDAERGRTLFEGLISAYPRKVDIWNVYIDQEIKHDSANRKTIEALFERVLKVKKLSIKQAKMFFKKWLGYETENGDVKGADYVKAKAAQFVEQHGK